MVELGAGSIGEDGTYGVLAGKQPQCEGSYSRFLRLQQASQAELDLEVCDSEGLNSPPERLAVEEEAIVMGLGWSDVEGGCDGTEKKANGVVDGDAKSSGASETRSNSAQPRHSALFHSKRELRKRDGIFSLELGEDVSS